MSNAYYRKVNILKDYNNLQKHIDDLTCDYCELLTKATKINQTLHDDTGPANHDNQSKVESFTILLAAKKDKLETAVEKKHKIDRALYNLGARGEYLIRKVDICGYPIKKVCKDLKIDYIYATKLRRKLIDRLNI